MTISLVSKALVLSLFASVASAQTGAMPNTPAAPANERNQAEAPAARATPKQQGRGNMLAALAKVEPGRYTNNEMIRIQQARSAGDTATLRFFLKHENRAATGTPLFPNNDAAIQ